MEDHKQPCARYLAPRFRGSSDWRRCQSAKFDDMRNDKAAQRLLELESSIEIPDTIWTSIAPYYNETDNHWTDLGHPTPGRKLQSSVIPDWRLRAWCEKLALMFRRQARVGQPHFVRVEFSHASTPKG